MQELYIIGAGGLGRELKALVQNINTVKSTFHLKGFIDDFISSGSIINGLEVKGNIDFLNKIEYPIHAIIAIGEAQTKRQVFDRLNTKFISFPKLIHPTAILTEEKFIEIGVGSVITANCILTTNITIGEHVLLNLNCTIGHEAHIDDFVSMMPAVNISGNVHIGDTVYIGTGAKVLNGLNVGKKSIIGAGAVVTKDVKSNITVVGIPAKETN